MTELQNLYLNFKEYTPMSIRKEHRGPSFLLSMVSGWELQEASTKRGMFCLFFLLEPLLKSYLSMFSLWKFIEWFIIFETFSVYVLIFFFSEKT